jgi:hypothetical protein
MYAPSTKLRLGRFGVLIILLTALIAGNLGLTLAQPSGPVISVAVDRLIFYQFLSGTTSPDASQTLTIRNTGTATLALSNIQLLNAGGQYSLGGTLPTSIPAGGQANVTITFTPSSIGVKTATLRITSNDPARPQLDVALRGLGITNRDTEPSLQWILDTFDLGVNVADPDPTNNALGRSPRLWGDEIPAQRFQKAGSGPVTIQPIALFGPGGTPVVRMGWYPTCNPAARAELFSINSTYSKSLNPQINNGGTTSFDPGSADFGLWSFWTQFPGQPGIYSEDSLNTWETNVMNRHKLRVYPLAEPNAYVIATEETAGQDYQDIVVILRNVRPAPLELTLEFNRTYPGTLQDKNGKPIGFVTTQANKYDQITNMTTYSPTATNWNSYSPPQIDLDTTQGVLRIDTTLTSSAQAGQWNTLVNALQLPYNATQGFTISTRLLGPFTNITTNSQQGGIFIGPDQDNFIKVIVARLDNANVIELYHEVDNGTIRLSRKNTLPALATIESIELEIVGDPNAGANGQIRGFYRVITTGGDQGRQPIVESSGQPVVINLQTAAEKADYFGADAWAGLTTSGRTPGSPIITFTYDRFAISAPAMTVPPTATPTNTPTNTPTSTPTNTPTSTPTNTPTSTATGTPTSTATGTPTSTATGTPTSTATTTATPTTQPTPGPTPEFQVYLPMMRR